jgi:uncharacterized damage-inducible protein DinB
MSSSNPLDILLAHGQWATRNVINACIPLTAEQFHRRFEMGPGSLHDTTTHILGATRFWTDLLAGRPARPRLETTQHTAAELLALVDEVYDDFNTVATAHPFDGLVTRVRNENSYQISRGAVLTHVTTHAMHHRAQCLNMLRHVGVTPLPPSSVPEWWFVMTEQKV